MDLYYLEKGNMLYQEKHYTKAIEEYEQALKINPTSAEAIFKLGLCYLSEGVYQIAIAYFSRLLELVPNSASALYNRSIANLSLLFFHKALEDVEAALDLQPKNPQMLLHRAIVNYALKNYAAACDDYYYIMQLKTNLTLAAIQGYEATRRKIQECEQSIKLCNKILRHAPLNNDEKVEFLIRRAQLKTCIGLYGEAIQDYDSALQITPPFFDADNKRLMLHNKLKAQIEKLQAQER